MVEYFAKTPVLIIFFNRSLSAQQVMQSVRAVRPPRVYLASDGPRTHVEGEDAQVKALRAELLRMIDWDCQVKTRFLNENLGCGPAVKSAIDWFFDHEEMGVVLEDDTVPVTDFYRYCDDLLEKYQHDERIGMISGNNHVGYVPCDSSYVFSRYKWTWGWATWRRAWCNMDLNLTVLQTPMRESVLRNMGYGNSAMYRWTDMVASLDLKSINAWDYQWFISLGAQNQLGIFPKVNLVANIGFGVDATHCKGVAPDNFTRTGSLEFPLIAPSTMAPDWGFEKCFARVMYQKPLWKKLVPRFVKQWIKRCFYE